MKIIIKAILWGGILFGSTTWAGEIYSYIDANGVRTYTDQLPSNLDNIMLRSQPTKPTIKKSTGKKSTGGHTLKIYKFVDSNNVIHITDKPKNSQYKLIYQFAVSRPYSTYKGADFIPKKYDDYDSLIQDVATNTGVEPALLHAMIQTESAYNPKAISPKGAVGLMQLMPATAKRFGVTNRKDVAANVYGGARYLRYLLDYFNNDMQLALAAYNAGENAVKRHGNKIPPYQETQNYVKKVIRLYHAYQK